MTEISIRVAQDDDDYEVARGICREWLDWHWNAYPEDWPTEGNPMDPEKFEVTLNDLPEIHARPRGAILIAFVDGRPAGCVMYNEAETDVAEFNRMFVNEGGRGHGIGRLMLERMFEEMTADGYRKVKFSSAKFLTHAKKMYKRAGFSDIPHPQDFPDAWRKYVYFMERQL
ncbi:MAG: GNAT family N-acetyltransferase [Rhodobacteraceae bacterium]|nr:GNAT family N-acetyltransferase [Paracoccaceae bacterium]